MPLQSKMTVYAAIAGTLALMGGIIYYASLDNEKLDQAEIDLINIELQNIDTLKNQATFHITFLVTNPSDKTFTVSQIGYKLFGDGIELGSGQYSTADIALPGRVVFYPTSQIPLKSIFTIVKTEINSDIYTAMINDQIDNYTAEGLLTTETSWSIGEKEFRIDLK